MPATDLSTCYISAFLGCYSRGKNLRDEKIQTRMLYEVSNSHNFHFLGGTQENFIFKDWQIDECIQAFALIISRSYLILIHFLSL